MFALANPSAGLAPTWTITQNRRDKVFLEEVVAAAVPFAQGNPAWGIVAGLALVAALFAFLAWRVEWSERSDRLKREEREQNLRDRPFHNTRIVVSEISASNLTASAVDKSPLDIQLIVLAPGSQHILIQSFARTGVTLGGGNLRFFGDQKVHPKPVVTKFFDLEPHGHPTGGREDNDDGFDFWYESPRPLSEGKAVYYHATIDVPSAEWAGEISLRLEFVDWGIGRSIRIPCRVNE